MKSSAPLTPEEASAAADCVAAMLEDFANLDPACVLMVWAGPATTASDDDHMRRPVDESATQARVAAARAALVKLRKAADYPVPMEWSENPEPDYNVVDTYVSDDGRVWKAEAASAAALPRWGRASQTSGISSRNSTAEA